ncbi:hypothetical protein OPT61_g4535 [Boeremia exigua]|uniref:Uncharacterized protein n=1 Tax=Boeremia exigua TaxID=749465 RepID=A0ACC2IDQ8_9PLEO|nr:hypothetical protein OPT61_g4535 [Boeremia exigua]
MPQQQHNINASKEAQIQLALQALKQDANLSQRRAASIYRVPQATLSYRHAGRPSRADTMPNSRGLDDNEERVIVEHILELDARGFGPWLADVAAMANSLRAERNLGPVSTNWPSTYNYKRALCKDSGIVQGWFSLVANVKAKYGIPDDDVHNFNKTGFMMGQISTGAVVTASERRGRLKTVQPGNWEWVTVIQGINAKGWAIPPFIIFKARHHLTGCWTTNELGLEWLKHFDRHTKERTVGTYRLLVIDGHESHESLQFQQYCKDNKIVTLCMPPHSSHLLQPLDVGCFSPLKTAYRRQAKILMCNQITHLTKSEFLPCFKAAYNAVFTASNIQGGFQGAGLVPFDPERVITALDVKLRTPSPPLPANNVPWQLQTPSNILEFGLQSNLI